MLSDSSTRIEATPGTTLLSTTIGLYEAKCLI